MNSSSKKMFFKSSLLALVGAIFFTSVLAIAPIHSANASTKFSPTVTVTYNGEFSSSNEDYTVTPTSSGITADSVISGGWNYSSTDSYVAITAKNGKAIATQTSGITLTFKQRTLVDRDVDKKAVDPYEQLFTVEGENGETAHICAGGVYYISGTGASSVYAQTPSSHYGMLTATEKHITITVDFTSNVIYVYFNGELAQKYIDANSRYQNVVSVVNTFESVLTQPNSTLYLRKPCENKASRNTESFVMGDVQIHNSVFTAEQAAEYYDSLNATPNFNVEINVENLTSEEFTQVSNGTGFEVSEEREGAFHFTDISSYLTITANEGKKLVSDEKGISFHFYQKNTTDTYYKDENAVRPEVTDDFEQLFCVEGENGELAYICTGGLYYVDADGTRTYAQPSTGIKKLLTTTWKYVSIVVNNSENSISVYVDGERAQYFSPTANKAAVTANVVSLFSSVATKEGASIYVRKSCPKREDRNTSTLVLDDIIIGNGTLTDAQVLDYYDSALGNARIRFSSNMQNSDIPDLVIKKGSALTVDSIPEIEGCVLEGLFTDENFTTPIEAGATINASCTVYVKYSLIEYTITYHGATVSENPTSYNLESNGVTILDAYKEGYVFDGWYRTENFENQTNYLVPGSYGNIDLYAKFTPVVYSVTYVKNGGVFQSAPVETFTVETVDFTLANLWKAHYDFVGWFLDEALESEITQVDTAIANDVTVYAKFSPVHYTIEYIVGENAVLSEGAITSYTVEDESVALATASKENYDFAGWFLDEALQTEITQIDVANANDITLYAKFTPTPYAIEYVIGKGGVLAEGAVTSYTVEDESITLVSASKNGYTFDGWFLDEALETAITQIDTTAGSSVTVYAKFSPIVYTIEYVVGKDAVLEEGAITSYTVEDESVTLATASKHTYTFEGWYLDPEFTQAISEIDTQKGENVTLYAKFTKNPTSTGCSGAVGSSTALLASLAFAITALFIHKKRGE